MTRFIFALLLLIPSFSHAADNAIWQKALDKQTLRCGYVTYEPGLVKDVNKGSLSGYDKDIMTAIAKRLEIKVEWVPTGGWGTFLEDMKSGKFDMLCNSYWVNAANAKYVLYARPNMYQPAFFVARNDDSRFDKDETQFNHPATSIAVIESDSQYFMVKNKYPKATIHALPHNFDFSLIISEVATKKSDLTIADAVTIGSYQKSNPGKVKLVQPDHPLQIYPAAFVMPSGETQMKQAIDQALDEMILSGELKKIFEKYNQYPHSFYYPTIQYEIK